jgi:DNA mismatch repair ATPase MutL
MKLKYVLGVTALSFLLASAAYPQQEQEKEKPAQQEEKRSEAPKQQTQKQEQKTQQQGAKQQEQKQQKNEQKQSEQANKQRQEQQKQLTKQEQEDQKQQQKQQQVARQQRQGTEVQQQGQRSDHDGGRRIPDDRFRASFGHEHHFRVEHVDNRRFQYGGYWFTFNEAWPVGWAYTDVFYIDFIDGEYYLIDLTHPGFQLLLVVD